MFNEWYLARDKHENYERDIICYPTALTGLRKYEGCHFYTPTKTLCMDKDVGEDAEQWGMALDARNCKKLFNHCPKKGELLCVKKTRAGWKSEKIELEFSE